MFADSILTRESSRRGWFTLVSFALQAFGLSILFAIPFVDTERLPQVRLRDLLLTPPPASVPSSLEPHPVTAQGASNLASGRLVTPSPFPIQTVEIQDPVSVSQIDPLGMGPGVFQGTRASELRSLVNNFSHVSPPVMHPSASLPARPISRWMEGNLIHKVQPVYPAPARSIGVCGEVLLRAVIGRNGRIEKLQVISGHPLLTPAAVDAVSQWVYKPYLLNDQAVEVETQVTVNFVLNK